MVNIETETLKKLFESNIPQTGFRVLMFLFGCTGPVSTGEISAAVGVSKKAILKSIRRLMDAGIIERGEYEARRRRFIIPGSIRGDTGDKPHQPHEPSESHDMSILIDRIDKLETTISLLVSKLETKTYPEATNQEPQQVIIPPSLGICTPWTGFQEPNTVQSVHAASLAASFLNKSIAADDQTLYADFVTLFGVPLPAGADRLAASEMVRRKRAGKLSDIKSPLGYLSALSGKVALPVTTQMKPVTQPAYTSSAEKAALIRNEISQLWERMDEVDREKYFKMAREKQDGKKILPKIEILARQIFNGEQMLNRGIVM